MNDLHLVADLLIAFNLGLVSQVHCVGMCGGIVGALSLAVDGDARQARGMLPFALAYNGGRVASYMLAGALLGAAGGGLVTLFASGTGHTVLRTLAGAILVVAGLSLLGVGAPAAMLEGFGRRLWLRLQRPARSLVPVRSARAAWLFGMLWGWLPCALVYATLLFAAASAQPGHAALVMLAFGLGTSPALLLAGTLAARGKLLRHARLRRAAGTLLVLAGLVYPFAGALFHHHGHAHPGPAPAASAPAHHH